MKSSFRQGQRLLSCLALLAFVAACGASKATPPKADILGAVSCLFASANWTAPDPGNAWTAGLDLTTQAIGDENVLPTEADTFNQMGTQIQSMQNALASMNNGVARGFHAKPHACVEGIFHVRTEALTQAGAGLFAADGDYPTWVRFSNGVGFTEPDKSTDVRGIALKVMKVPGTSLEPQAAPTQDFLMTNAPITPAPDSQQFINFGQAMVDATTSSPSNALGVIDSMLKTGGYLSDPQNARVCAYLKSRAFASVVKNGSLMAEQFWTGGAISMGVTPSADGNPEHAHANAAFKLTAIPGVLQSDGSCATVQQVPNVVDDNYLRTDVIARMQAGETCIDLQIQFQTNPATEPIEDTSVEWTTADSPFTSIGWIEIPQTDLVGDPVAQQKEQFCDALSFTPWHTLPEHRPLGNIMRARKVVYGSSASLRGASAEPTGDEFTAPGCTGLADGDYCGGDGVANGDPNTLYSCSSGSVTASTVCANGCQVSGDAGTDSCG